MPSVTRGPRQSRLLPGLLASVLVGAVLPVGLGAGVLILGPRGGGGTLGPFPSSETLAAALVVTGAASWIGGPLAVSWAMEAGRHAGRAWLGALAGAGTAGLLVALAFVNPAIAVLAIPVALLAPSIGAVVALQTAPDDLDAPEEGERDPFSGGRVLPGAVAFRF
jgi:hypothetical protein